jgi:hypothetical protein
VGLKARKLYLSIHIIEEREKLGKRKKYRLGFVKPEITTILFQPTGMIPQRPISLSIPAVKRSFSFVTDQESVSRFSTGWGRGLIVGYKKGGLISQPTRLTEHLTTSLP